MPKTPWRMARPLDPAPNGKETIRLHCQVRGCDAEEAVWDDGSIPSGWDRFRGAVLRCRSCRVNHRL